MKVQVFTVRVEIVLEDEDENLYLPAQIRSYIEEDVKMRNYEVISSHIEAYKAE